MKQITVYAGLMLVAIALGGCGQTPVKAQPSNATQKASAQEPSERPQPTAQGKPAIQVGFRLAQTQPAEGLDKLELGDDFIWYLRKPILTQAEIANAQPRRTQQGQAFVRFWLTQPGAQRFATVAGQYPNKLLMLTMNNSLVAISQVGSPGSDGTLDFPVKTDELAVNIVKLIAGETPVDQSRPD